MISLLGSYLQTITFKFSRSPLLNLSSVRPAIDNFGHQTMKLNNQDWAVHVPSILGQVHKMYVLVQDLSDCRYALLHHLFKPSLTVNLVNNLWLSISAAVQDNIAFFKNVMTFAFLDATHIAFCNKKSTSITSS